MATERFAYIHCKPDGTPFYVGKGALRRAKYLGERNDYHKAVVNKYGRKNILIGMWACSDHETAYELERGLIKRLRAMGVSLANFTAGGDGGKDPCPETRKRMSEAAKRRGVSKACAEARNTAKKGKPLSEEHRAKIRASLLGRKFSEEHRRNISKSAKLRAMPEALVKREISSEERSRRSQRMLASWAARRFLKGTSL